MTKIDFHDMVAVLAKPGADIVNELTAEDAHLLHMAVGVSGEAGELLDAVKKSVIYRKPIDLENVIEELGDLEFYMEGVRQRFGITRQDTIDANIAKLGKRYEGFAYSDRAAAVRADKAPAPRKFIGMPAPVQVEAPAPVVQEYRPAPSVGSVGEVLTTTAQRFDEVK